MIIDGGATIFFVDHQLLKYITILPPFDFPDGIVWSVQWMVKPVKAICASLVSGFSELSTTAITTVFFRRFELSKLNSSSTMLFSKQAVVN